MIAKKRETFRIEIRRQETEEKFKQKRYNVQGMAGLNGMQIVNEIGVCMTNGDQEGIQKQLGLLILHLSKGGDSERQQYDWVGGLFMEPYISNELILQQVLLLNQCLCEQMDVEQFEQFVEQIDLVNMYTQILYDGMNYSVDLIELLFYNLEMISRKSLCCQSWLISWDIITILNTILPQLQYEYNDYCMISILGLIQSFLEGTSRVPFSKCNNIIIIINTMCKKLRQIQYMNATFESDIQIEEGALAEIKTEVLIKLMTVIKYYSDKSGSTVNLCEHKSVWIVITTICFHQLLSLKLRRIAVTILDVILTSSNSMIIKVIEHQPDIYYNLIMLLDVHSDDSLESNKIRYHCTSALRSLFSVEDIRVLNNLHLNQIPVQFLHFHKQEKQPRIIYHQIESLFYILSYSHYQQIKQLIDNDIITITCGNLEDSIQTNNIGCIKQLLKILSALLQHSTKDDRIIPNLKQNNIIGLFESIQRFPQETLQHRAQTLMDIILQ